MKKLYAMIHGMLSKDKSLKKKRSTASPKSPNYLSPAVSRAMEILRLIASNPEGITLARLCRESDIAKNSIFRILNSLTEEGILQRDPSSQHFSMTGQLLGLAYRGTGADVLSQVVFEPMRQLRDKSGETVLFGKLLGERGIVLEQFPSTHPVKVQVEIGTTFLMHCAAPAKAILASFPLKERERICNAISYPQYTARTIQSPSEMLDALSEVERSGIAFDWGEQMDDIRCVGSAIIDHRNLPAGALWITGPSSRLSDSQLKKLGALVLQTARFVSRQLGNG